MLFARRGWFTGLFDVSADGLARVANEIGSQRSCAQVLDVTDAGQFAGAVDRFAARTGGRMDVLFNCAGILRIGWFEELSADEDVRQLHVNVLGMTIGIRAALPLLRQTAGAHIVSMASSAALFGTPELAVYSASKHAVRGMTEALALEFERYGITVCDVAPPVVSSPMVLDQPHLAGIFQNRSTWITPEVVAEVVWKAAHGRRLHWEVTAQVRLIAFLFRLLPFLSRSIMRYLASPRPGGAGGKE